MNETVQLCDLSDYGTLRIAGKSAQAFLETMYSGDMGLCSELGCMSDGLLLNSLGQVVDAVQLFKTGDFEFLLLTSPENTDEVCEWLEAHAELSDDQGKIFPDVDIQDQSEHMAVLVMFGRQSKTALDELLNVCADRVALFIYAYERECYGVPAPPSYLVFAPMNAASAIGGFLTESFNAEIIGFDDYRKLLEKQGHFAPKLHDAEYVMPADIGMESLLRSNGGFVGASALGV